MCARLWWLPRAGSGQIDGACELIGATASCPADLTARYRSEIEATSQRWGGGWQSTLEVGGDGAWPRGLE